MIETIKEIVSKQTKVSVEQMESKRRFRHIADAKKIAVLIMFEYTYYTLKVIGNSFNTDHSTVLCCRDAARDFMVYDKSFLRKYTKCALELEAMGYQKVPRLNYNKKAA